MNNYPYNNNQGSGYGYNSQYSPAPQYSAPSPTPEPPKNKKKKRIWPVVTAAVSGVAAGAIVMGAFFMPKMNANRTQIEVLPSASAQTETVEGSASTEAAAASQLGGESLNIENAANPVVEIAENAGKSVVGVNTYSTSYVSGRQPIKQKIASGTGFVISADGLILTNHHVVEGGSSATVQTSDGEELEAEIVGSDPNLDVAVLRVPEINLPALPIGDSTAAKTGELVVAIGNPLREELNGTVTVGYLSGTNRRLEHAETGQEVEMLQIDAAINPGNSGGPLLNSKGEVIGINSMKSVYAGADAYGNVISAEGIAFAIPINNAVEVAQQIIETGSVPLAARPGIGISYQPISAEDAQTWGVPQGAMIANVVPGSPAAAAGIQMNDIIIAMNGVDVVEAGGELPTFDGMNVGDTVSVTIWRNGLTGDLELTLADLNELG